MPPSWRGRSPRREVGNIRLRTRPTDPRMVEQVLGIAVRERLRSTKDGRLRGRQPSPHSVVSVPDTTVNASAAPLHSKKHATTVATIGEYWLSISARSKVTGMIRSHSEQ